MTTRNYLTIEELQTILGITIANPDKPAAERLIDQAERLIDAYLGFVTKFIPPTRVTKGIVTSVSDKTIFDVSDTTPLAQTNGYFSYTQITVVGGTGAGQKRNIVSSSKDNKSITVDTAFSPQLDSTSFYIIEQIGKLPRRKDVFTTPDSQSYYKLIPDAVKQAIAVQYQFMNGKGAGYFSGTETEFTRERIDDYEYEKGNGAGAQATAAVNMLSPQARALLRGIAVRTGRLVPSQDSTI